MIKMGSFRSYVGLEEYEMKIPSPVSAAFLQPIFLDGEVVIAEADNVLKFSSVRKKNGLSGSLFVTNARLVFVSSDQASTEDSIPLLSISTLCYYEEPKGSGGRKIKRKVKLGVHTLDMTTSGATPSSTLFCSASTRIHELLVNCSNFRSLRFSFRFSLLDHGQKICNALIHWSFPKQPEKLFYLDYCRAIDRRYHSVNALPIYNIPGDWLREIKMTHTSGHRISLANMNFEVCESLPETIVVPADVTDVRLISLSGKLKGSRPPFWVWGNASGAAILRMGHLHNESDSAAENQFFETLRKAHPKKRPPRILDLDSAIPIKDVRQSMTRLFELFCSGSLSHIEDADTKFLSNLDNTKWLTWSCKVLELCSQITDWITNFNDVIILQENESRDSSCLIGSVSQLILDARFRSGIGFFSLIQKDWVSTGHAFHSNYMHASPLFLLFLDSVYQLLHQNPFEFEFNETILNDIWDSCFDPTTGTFLFDTPFQRKSLELRKDFNVWNRILSKDEISVEENGDRYPRQALLTPAQEIPKGLLNPLYKLRNIISPALNPALKTKHQSLLTCIPSMPEIQLWRSLYMDRGRDPVDFAVWSTTKSPTPYAKNMDRLTPSPVTPKMVQKTRKASPSPNHHQNGSIFLFSTTSDQEKECSRIEFGGRNFFTEHKIVETLIASTSAMYQKRSAVVTSGTSRTSTQNSGPAIPPRFKTTRPSVHSRKNPFLES